MKKTYKFLIPTTIIAVFSLFLYLGYIEAIKTDISNNLLRLHIVGADDSEYAQNLKLCVRDKIIYEFSDIFSECSSAKDSAAKAKKYQAQIKKAAEEELKAHNCEKSVSVEIKKCRFPTKKYGEITLPGGIYTALNILIGGAEGKNWWCVMYPPLCINEGNVIASEASKNKLKSLLSADEYKLITDSDESNIKIKFKIAEILGRYFK